MLLLTFSRAINIIKFGKNTYHEIAQDKNSIYGAGIIIILAALVNVILFKTYLLPNLPNKVPLQYIFIVWIFFNWIIFPFVLLFIVKMTGGKQNLEDKKIVLSFVGFSNTAEILKIIIILLPNFIVLISWGALMLVIATQVLGVKQIYNLQSTALAAAVIIGSYFVQFFIIGIIVVTLIKLAY